MRQIFRLGKIKIAGVRLVIAAAVFLATGLLVSAQAAEVGRFQVVAGKDESSYLVDTTTGSVWVLTYRTLVTGREPIAIPYKFIKITPKDQGYIVENTSQMAPGVDKGGEGDRGNTEK
jgi:hypothetical protein